MIQAPPNMDIMYDTEHDHVALSKQLSDDRDLATEPASFAQRAKRWSLSIANGKRINDQFYGKATKNYILERWWAAHPLIVRLVVASNPYSQMDIVHTR